MIIKKCDSPNCSIGNFDIEGNCILSVNKSMAILLNEKLSKVGQFLKIKQSFFSLMMELDRLDRKHTEIDLYEIDVSPYNEHSIFINRILNTTPQNKHNLLSIAKTLCSSRGVIRMNPINFSSG